MMNRKERRVAAHKALKLARKAQALKTVSQAWKVVCRELLDEWLESGKASQLISGVHPQSHWRQYNAAEWLDSGGPTGRAPMPAMR